LDAEIKEFGFIVTFALLIGFGYFNISIEDEAFTQPAPPYRYLSAENYDVPDLITEQGLLLQNGIPLSWVDVYWEDQEDPPNMFGLQQAFAAEFYLKPTEHTAVRQTGNVGLSTCPAITGPSSAGFIGAVHGAKARTIGGDTAGCTYGVKTWEILLPLEFEKDLLNSIDPFFWGFDWIPGGSQWNAADNTPSSICEVEALSGANGTVVDARLNATAAYDGIFSNSNLLSSIVGFCDRDNDERTGLRDARVLMVTDYLQRDNKTFYQVGTFMGTKTTNRDTIVQSIPVPNSFLKYNFPLPANNTSTYWQMQEHPMFEAAFPAISTGSMQNVTNKLQLDTGDVNSEVGQVIIFKAFNTTDLGILGDIRVVGEFQSIGTTADMQLHIEVKDGNIQAGQTEKIKTPAYPLHQVGVFRDNQRMVDIGLFDGPFDTKSSLNVNNSLSVIDIVADTAGVIQPFDISFTPYWAGSSDVVTVMVGLQDNSASGRMVMNITSIEIEDEVKYNFGSISNLFFLEPNCSTNMAETITRFNEVDLNVQHIRNCGLDNSNGLVALNTVALSGVTGLPNPTPAAVTGLLVTFIGDIANLTWNHPQTNVTSFQIERDTGDGFKTIHYVTQNKLTTLDRTSLDLSGADTDLLGLPRSTSTTYRVTPLNGAISGLADTDTKTSNTISDEWQWREYNFVPTIAVNQTLVVNQTVGAEKRLEFQFHTTVGNRQGDGWLFKVFPIAFINNSQIEIDWEGFERGTHSGGALNAEIHIFDGVVNRFNTTQFDVSVGGVAGQTLPPLLFDFDSVDFQGLPFTGPLSRETKIVTSGDPTWGISNSSLITLAVVYHDGGGKEGSMKVASIKIADAFYNFSDPTIILEQQDLIGELVQDRKSFDFQIKDPETQQDTGLVIPSSANVTISIPINFQVIQDMASEAELDWSDSLGADTYDVFRNGTLIGSPILSEFTDTTLSLGVHYLYKVRAINTQGTSGNSTIIDFGLIDPITNLNVDAINSTSIQLAWDLATTSHPTDLLTGVLIQRNGTTITTVDDLDTSFVDIGLTPSTNFQYQVKGVTTVSTGAFSNLNNTSTLANPPAAITDLTVRIENTTAIYSPGASGATQIFDKFPTIITQVTPTFTTPTLIDSILIDIKETGATALPTGTVQAVIVGDRTGDLTDGSLLSNIYFIENSTNTISTSLLPGLFVFNFSGNTILDSIDFDVGVGIAINTHDAEITMDLFGSGAFGKMIGTGADCAGDNLVFDDEGCTGVATSDLSGLTIFGGDPRAVLSWTTPAGSPTGYEILVQNATELMIYKETFFGDINTVNATLGDNTNGEIVLGTDGDPNGHIAGQRITFTHDFVVTSLVATLGAEDTDYTTGFIQGVILKDAPAGQSGFVLVTNSTNQIIDLDGTVPDHAYFFGNPPNCCAQSFSFQPIILSKDVEYIIGIQPTDVSDPITVFADHPDNNGFPNNGLGQFTQLNPNVSPVWFDNSTLEFNAQIFGYNMTTLVSDTGNTNTKFIDTVSDYPSSDGKINARVYDVKAINSGGSANASNFVEISPDRDLFDTWQLKEQDTRFLFNTDCTFQISTELGGLGDPPANAIEMEFDSTTETSQEPYINTCSIFKSFDKADILGSDINIQYNTTATGPGSAPFIRVLDGGYDKDNSGDFAKGENPFFVPKGVVPNGFLNATGPVLNSPPNCSSDVCNVTIPASDINYSGSVESQITLQIEMFGGFKLQIDSITISNVGSWDFTNNPRLIHTINNERAPNPLPANDNNTATVQNLAWEDDRAIVVANAFVNGSISVVVPNPPTAFTAIPVAPYKIDLDWVHDLIDVTGYNIYRGNATVPFILIAATNNATITEFEDANQLNLTAAIVNSLKNARGLAANTNFNYTICAFNGVGEEQTCATTSATTADDTDVWNLKEHDGEVNVLATGGADVDFTATGGTGDWLSTKTSLLARAGNSATLWKSFNVSEITGSDLEIFWDHDVTGTADTFQIIICEDKVTTYNETIWVGDTAPVCTAIENIRTIGPTGSGTALEPIFTRFSLDWTQITNQFITIFTAFDDDLLASSYDLDIRNFTWTNATSWDFTGLTINYTNTNTPPLDGADFECNGERPNFSHADMCNSGVFLATSSANLELKAVEGTNDWQYREYTDLTSADDIPFLSASIDSSGFKMTASQAPSNDDPTEVGEMFFFKSFPASSVINKNITISWDGVIGVESAAIGASVLVFNGTIDRWSFSDFPVHSELATERELIDTLTLLDESIPFSIVGNSETVANVPSESTVTVVIRMNDQSSIRDGIITIQNVTVGDTFYDFETGTIAEEVSGRNGGDRGLVTPSSVIAGVTPDQVTGLVITQEMNNNATMNWDNATGADNYQVLRKTNFTQSENANTNSTWQTRHQKNGVGGLDSGCFISVSSGPTGNVLCNWSDGGASTGSVYYFKTFPRDLLNNTSVQISMSETVGLGSPPHTTKKLRILTSSGNNVLDRNDELQWTASLARNWNSFNQTIDGVDVNSDSVSSLTTQSTFTSTITSTNWAVAPDSDFASIIWEMNDLNSLAGAPDTRVFWINITDLDTGLPVAFYNFSGGSTINEAQDPGCTPICSRGTIDVGTVIIGDLFEEVGTPINSDFEDSTIPLLGVSTYKVRGNGTGGFGLNSTEVDFGLIQPIANLNATALNSTAIKLSWDLAKTEHPTDPLTGVIIQRVSPESIVYACSVCGSTGVEVGPLPNKVYGQRITLNQTETIDKIVNQQRWFNGAVTGGTIDVFIAHPNGTIIQSSVEKKSAVTIGIGNQDLDERTYTFSPGVTLVAGVYDFMTRWDGVGFTNAVTGKNAGNPNAGLRVLDTNNNFNDGYTPTTIASEDTTIFLNTTGFVTIITVDELVTMFNDTGLLENTTYTYRAKGESAVSTGSFGENDTATTSALITAIINAPTGFAGIANTTDITLSWNNQTDKETWTLSRNGSDIALGLTVLSFQDIGVPLNANLGYILTAVNTTAGITNSTSEIVVLSNDIPSIVTGVGAMPINGVAILVEWDDPVADDGEGSPTTGLNVLYDIFRRDVGLGDPFSFLTTVAEGIALFNDTTVIGGHTFSYQLSSRNEVGSAANSTEASAMVDNALIIRALESDGVTDLNGDVSFRVFNSTFTSTKIGDGQGRASFPTLSGIYNFTIFHIPTDFLINKTVTSVVVTPINDVVVNVTTQVHRVNCASNGPANDFIVLVNSTSPDHFISDFTSPVCDVDDKVSWNVLFEGFQGTAIGGGGGGGGGANTTSKQTPLFNLIGEWQSGIAFQTDVNSTGYIGQRMDNVDTPIGTTYSVEAITFASLDTLAATGNVTGVILNNVSSGTLTGDHVLIASTPKITLGVSPFNQNPPRTITLNFTTPVPLTLDGTDFIGIFVEGTTFLDIDQYFFNNQGQSEGTCFVNDNTSWEDCQVFNAFFTEDMAMEVLISDTSNTFQSTGGIEPSKLVLYHTFDVAQVNNVTIGSNSPMGNNTALSNAGTLGSDADATIFRESSISKTDSVTFNTTGIIGEGWEKDSEIQFIVGNELNKNQFDFLHDNVTDTWSANFWVKQNTGEFFVNQGPTGHMPFISTVDGEQESGIVIYAENATLGVYLSNEADETIIIGNVGTAMFPADTDWHMATIIVEKSNVTSTATTCIDNVCNKIDRDFPHQFSLFTPTKSSPMYLGEELEDRLGGVFNLPFITFGMDELCIWKDYKLTSANRATLFNSGSGARCGTVSAGNGTGGVGGPVSSSFTTQMKTLVLSLGDFGNNAKNFIINGTALPTTFGTPIITSDPIVVSTSTSNVLLNFDELFLQSQAPPPPVISPPPPPPTPPPGGGGVPALSAEDQKTFFEDLFGFSLFAKIHQMSVGQIQDGTIDITWNSPSQIVIEGIEVGDQFITWIGFPRTPFTLDGSDRISTGKIPYRIMPPNQLCDEVTGQTINCVDRILYEIPVTIHATIDGQPLTANTVIKVNLSLDITLALFTIFIMFAAGVGAIIYRAVIVHPRQKRREKKKLPTRSKERTRIEQRFSAKKSKLRRRP